MSNKVLILIPLLLFGCSDQESNPAPQRPEWKETPIHYDIQLDTSNIPEPVVRCLSPKVDIGEI